MKLLGLIPARSGSKRVVGKNLRPLAGHPLIAHTIVPAIRSGIMNRVVVSTDCAHTAEVARRYGAEVPFLRPLDLASDTAPDIGWVIHALTTLEAAGESYDAFVILRPTSPFRTPTTLVRALETFQGASDADSLRAVEPCRQHPAKMWTAGSDGFLKPLLDDGGAMPPWHSSATQSLAPVLVQNASLEIAWSHVPQVLGTIAGRRILGFHTVGYEGFDINQPDDFLFAETLVERGVVKPFLSQL